MNDAVIYTIEDYKDVHTEHCCLIHDNCKYGDDNCTVLTLKKKQSYSNNGKCFCDDSYDQYWGHSDDIDDIPF